ncbi:MAG: hypothetical protein ACI8ZX_001954 [Planctomycetota bacterium]|jgi:hypothetical protein
MVNKVNAISQIIFFKKNIATANQEKEDMKGIKKNTTECLS